MNLSEKTLRELKNKKISIENLNDQYLINSSNKIEVKNILKLLNENICSFKQIVDKCKSIQDDRYSNPCLYKLLSLLDNKELFKELIQNNKLNTDDLKYLLSTIDDWSELITLCCNPPLTKHILNEFILNKENVDRFNTIVENSDEFWRDWFEERNIHTIFDLIEYRNKNNEEILKLNELNEKSYLLNNFDLNEDQQLELIELIQNNEIAQNRLIQIVDSKLENNYDFDSLMVCLSKTEKRNLINI